MFLITWNRPFNRKWILSVYDRRCCCRTVSSQQVQDAWNAMLLDFRTESLKHLQLLREKQRYWAIPTLSIKSFWSAIYATNRYSQPGWLFWQSLLLSKGWIKKTQCRYIWICVKRCRNNSWRIFFTSTTCLQILKLPANSALNPFCCCPEKNSKTLGMNGDF